MKASRLGKIRCKLVCYNCYLVSTRDFFSSIFFWYHGTFGCSSCKRNQIVWASLYVMDVSSWTIHEDFEGICEESMSSRNFHYWKIYFRRIYWVLFPEKCWHSRRYISKSSKGVHVIRKSREEVLQAHLYILNNTDEVLPYLDTHKDIVKYKNPRQLEKWVLIEHNKTFMSWFKQKIMNDPSASETLI